MLHAMIVGRTGVYRKWVKPDDSGVVQGRMVTEALLEAARERARLETKPKE
jgi:hypothetical protein